jgi:hypothetical protein
MLARMSFTAALFPAALCSAIIFETYFVGLDAQPCTNLFPLPLLFTGRVDNTDTTVRQVYGYFFTKGIGYKEKILGFLFRLRSAGVACALIIVD